MTRLPYPHRDGVINDIATVRATLITLVSEKPYDSDKGFAIAHISAAYKDLVQSLCMIDDTDRRNEALGSELGSLIEMKQSLIESLTDIAGAVGSDKAEYVEEAPINDQATKFDEV